MFEKDLMIIRSTLSQQAFVMRVYEGLTKSEACADMRINPAAVGIVRKENKQFDQAIRDAEAFRVDMEVDKLSTINEDIDCPIMAGVISKNVMWKASKRQRDIYGDKTDITIDHKLSITAAIEQANQRVLQFIDGKALIIDHSATDNISVEQPKISEAVENDDPFA